MNSVSPEQSQWIPVMTNEDWKRKASLYSKIAAVTGGMRRVEKNSKFTGGQAWNYSSWDDIAEVLNQQLGEAKLAILPTQVGDVMIEDTGASTSSGTPIKRHYVVVDFMFCDGDTGATETRRWSGHAFDSSDKGIDKAFTYVVKSMMKKTFMISTGKEENKDDPEGQDYESREGYSYGGQTRNYGGAPQQKQERQQRQQKPPAQHQPPAQQEPAPPTVQQLDVQEEKKPALPTGGIEVVPPKVEPTASAPTTTKTARDFPTFLREAEEQLGVSRADVKEIIERWGKVYADAKGSVAYRPEHHERMFASLVAWQTLQRNMLAAMTEGSELTWKNMDDYLTYLGFTKPYTDAALVMAMPVFQKYMAFVKEAFAILPDKERISKILTSGGITPWRPEKTELALQTLKSAVEQYRIEEELEQKAAAAQNEDIVEENSSLSDLVEITNLATGQSETLDEALAAPEEPVEEVDPLAIFNTDFKF